MTTLLPVAGFGLSHHTAPLGLRERFAFGPHARQQWYEHVRDTWPGEEPPEILLLSTCNRTECLFASREDLAEVQGSLTERLRAAAGVTQLTRIPVSASSLPSDLVSPMTPALAAE